MTKPYHDSYTKESVVRLVGTTNADLLMRAARLNVTGSDDPNHRLVHIVAKDGSFETRNLINLETKIIELDKLEQLPFVSVTQTDMGITVFYKPISKIFGALDLFSSHPPNTVSLVNATTNSNYDILRDGAVGKCGLLRIANGLPENTTTINVYFAVPDFMFDWF